MRELLPVTLTLDGAAGTPVALALDSGGRAELTPEQARALADDLYALADEWEG